MTDPHIEVFMDDEMIELLCNQHLIKIVESIKKQHIEKQKLYDTILDQLDTMYKKRDVATLMMLSKQICKPEEKFDYGSFFNTFVESKKTEDENKALREEVKKLKLELSTK